MLEDTATTGYLASDEGTKGARTRARVLAAARRLIVARGYHATSMRQIAREAGLTLGGIYNHFGGKEDIFSAVMLDHNPYLAITPALRAAQGDTIEALVRDAADRLRESLEGRPDALQLLLVEIVEFKGQHLAQLSESESQHLLAFAQRLVQTRGTLRPIPLPTLTRTLVALLLGYFLTGWLLGEQFPADLEPQAFGDFVDVYLHGIAE